MKLTAEQPTLERIAIIEDALAIALNIDSSMYVSADGGERYVSTTDPSNPDCYHLHDLYEIAREMERLLS